MKKYMCVWWDRSGGAEWCACTTTEFSVSGMTILAASERQEMVMASRTGEDGVAGFAGWISLSSRNRRRKGVSKNAGLGSGHGGVAWVIDNGTTSAWTPGFRGDPEIIGGVASTPGLIANRTAAPRLP
jgi:hypothetical protein